MDVSAPLLDELKRRARAAATHAYAPYSKFPVGAAVLTADARIYSGVNVENASYGLTICAERSAIFAAVADGAREIAALVIYTPTAAATPPCGACRQVLMEFGRNAEVVCFTAAAEAERRYRSGALLPDAFDATQL